MMEECYWRSNYSVEQLFGSHESKRGRRPELLNRLSSNWVRSHGAVWWYEKFERKDLNHFGLGRELSWLTTNAKSNANGLKQFSN